MSAGERGPDAGKPGSAGAPPVQGRRLIDIADTVDAEDIPLFLARQTYRRRRLMDAARLLPAVGLGLVLFPLLWIGQGEGPQTRAGVIYLFAVWALLTAVAALVAARLSAPLPPGTGDERDDVV
ncbi:hypothetical protein [Oceanicola sp. 502str15]|uniref:hypothetical protein n=1 Tax=Oceanicola sp. 502str15 TaxID=2696061 RepID=UPI002111C38E|nr:hypothetical protein [Oceanicola sp. 502str15]